MTLSSSVLLNFVSINLITLDLVVSVDAPRETASAVFEKPCSIPLVEALFQCVFGKKNGFKKARALDASKQPARQCSGKGQAQGGLMAVESYPRVALFAPKHRDSSSHPLASGSLQLLCVLEADLAKQGRKLQTLEPNERSDLQRRSQCLELVFQFSKKKFASS